MRKLKVVITYRDDTWTQVFDLEDGEEIHEVLEEIQDEWIEEFSEGEMDWDEYDIQCDELFHYWFGD